MKNFKSITIKQLAVRAGVSHSTVSRALNNHPAISPETVERIQQLARELNYVPSHFARSLKTNRSHMLGVIVHRIADPFYSEVLGGIQSVAHQFQYSMFVSASEHDMERQAGLIRGMFGRQVDALIIGDSFLTSEKLNELEIRVPMVFIHNRATEVLPYSLYHDDVQGTRALTRHLLDLGHRRIAFGGNERGGLLQQQRRQGVVAELKAAGLELHSEYDLLAPNGQMSSGALLAKQLLNLPERPTAIICFNDMQAIGVMQTLQQTNIRLPEDISVAGFDDIPLAEFIYPALTTYCQPSWELGQRASFTGMKGLGIQDCAIQESMGPISDRTIEHLLISDGAIVKIRRLLLQTLKDHAAGKPLPGMDPRSYRVHSVRCEVPKGARFAETMEARVRVDAEVTAK